MLGSRPNFCGRSWRERRYEAVPHSLCECGHRRTSLVDWRAPLAATPLSHDGSWPCKCADHSVPSRNAWPQTEGARATRLGNEWAAAHAERPKALAEGGPVRRAETAVTS